MRGRCEQGVLPSCAVVSRARTERAYWHWRQRAGVFASVCAACSVSVRRRFFVPTKGTALGHVFAGSGHPRLRGDAPLSLRHAVVHASPYTRVDPRRKLSVCAASEVLKQCRRRESPVCLRPPWCISVKLPCVYVELDVPAAGLVQQLSRRRRGGDAIVAAKRRCRRSSVLGRCQASV